MIFQKLVLVSAINTFQLANIECTKGCNPASIGTNHHSLPGTILPCKILFSPRNYTSQKRSINWRIYKSLSWPRNYTSQKRSVNWRICNSLWNYMIFPKRKFRLSSRKNCEYKFKISQTIQSYQFSQDRNCNELQKNSFW